MADTKSPAETWAALGIQHRIGVIDLLRSNARVVATMAREKREQATKPGVFAHDLLTLANSMDQTVAACEALAQIAESTP